MKALIFTDDVRSHPSAVEHFPPLLSVGDTPLIEHTVMLLQEHGVTDIAIRAEYRPWAIVKHLGHGRRWGVRVHYSVEEPFLGSAGAAKRLEWFLDESFVVLNGHVYTDVSLTALFSVHGQAGAPVTLALHPAGDAPHCDLAQLDDRGQICRFLEQSPAPDVTRVPGTHLHCAQAQVARHTCPAELAALGGKWARPGAMVIEPHTLATLAANLRLDFLRDVFPRMLTTNQSIMGFETAAHWIDLRSPQGYQEAQRLVTQQPSGQVPPMPSGSIIAPTANNMLRHFVAALLD